MHLVNFYLNVSTAPICFVFVDVKMMETSHDDLGFCEDVTGSPVGQLSIKKKKKIQNPCSIKTKRDWGEAATFCFAASIAPGTLEKCCLKVVRS